MAKRIKPITEPGTALPDNLAPHAWYTSDHWMNYADPIPEFLKDEEEIENWLRYKAWKRLQKARKSYLSRLMTKPPGVGALEWLTAHGLTYEDRGTSKASDIGC